MLPFQYFSFTLIPDTLLNPKVVPFLEQCNERVAATNTKQLMECGSYFEMVNKLNASNANGLSTLDDFTKEMSVYDMTQIDEFCQRFPGYIPKDVKQYPQSYKLFNFVNKRCEAYCSDDTDIDKIVIKQICRVFAIGFRLSDTKVQPSINTVSNTSISQQVEENKNSENVKSDVTLKPESTVDIAKQGGQNISMVAVKNVDITDNVPKEKVDVADENVPKDMIDAVDQNFPKENENLNVKIAAAGFQKIDNVVTDSKSISVKDNQTPSIKPEVKTTGKVTIPSENPITNAQAAEKPAINVEQPSVDADNANDDDDLAKDDLKVVTDFNDNFPDDSDTYNKDNMNDGDIDSLDDANKKIIEDSKNIVDDNYSIDQKLPKEQLHNEDPFTDDTDSNFFTYFMFILLVCVIAYVVYHNKSKMLALMLEGRRSSTTNGRSGLSRRKHTAAYRKLDSNLEEAITSSANGRSTQVIY